jgi:drug/metabolite transporter (DMT)-like permease
MNSAAITKPFQWIVILAAVISVAIADILLKKAASHSNLLDALRSPWFAGAAGLYMLQVCFFMYAFIAGWNLTNIGILQTALYAIIVLTAGVFFYNETFTRFQWAGIFIAMSGVLMINWK